HTHLADLAWCPRNFLHRYRLAFFADATSSQRQAQGSVQSAVLQLQQRQQQQKQQRQQQMPQVEVVKPLPPDLVSALQAATPLGAALAEALEGWLQPQCINGQQRWSSRRL
ncbi:unnamed protein product, partial [Polarella glacialis]